MENVENIQNFDLGDLADLDDFDLDDNVDLMKEIAEQMSQIEDPECDEQVQEMVENVLSQCRTSATTSHSPKTPECSQKFRDYIKSMRNKATTQKTEQVVRKYQLYLQTEHKEERRMEEIEPERLNTYLGIYFMSCKKPDGTDNEPDSLTAVHRALERHLRDKGYSENILTSSTFETSRGVLASRRKELKGKGKGNKPNRACALSEEDIELLWEKGVLGLHCADVIQKTLYFFICSGFGLRGCHEARQLKWGDVQMIYDNVNGERVKYLEFTERFSKTRQGAEGGDVRPFKPKIFAIGGDRCPIRAYENFLALRPDSMLQDECPFFLSVNHKKGGMGGYAAAPMGKNTLSKIVKDMTAAAGLQGRYSNHSLRKTLCQTLLGTGVPPLMIAQLVTKMLQVLPIMLLPQRHSNRACRTYCVTQNVKILIII